MHACPLPISTLQVHQRIGKGGVQPYDVCVCVCVRVLTEACRRLVRVCMCVCVYRVKTRALLVRRFMV